MCSLILCVHSRLHVLIYIVIAYVEIAISTNSFNILLYMKAKAKTKKELQHNNLCYTSTIAAILIIMWFII
jgi:hypothetical protein